MAEYEIASVVWDERDNQIHVTYVEDEPDHMVATQFVAAELARDAGLSIVAAPDGIRQWVQNPRTSCVATEQGSTGNAESPHDRRSASRRNPLSGAKRDGLWILEPHS